jgi:hypothetical protein
LNSVTFNALGGSRWRADDSLRQVELGEGFITQIKDDDYLAKHGLLGKDVLTFVNDLSALVEENKRNDTLSRDERISLDFALTRFMVIYDDGELYYYLLHAYGPDALNYSSWVRFASDTSWPICVRTFSDMPTSILEEYGVKDWHERTKYMRREDVEVFLKAIGKRNDIYGSGSLPMEMMEGILFGSL